MDANPSQQFSPQTVGNEFVRQYYTVLNKAPSHLHRFYNNYSTYTHGDSQLVVGQREIHSLIQQLDFKECETNITSVDAQASPGGGVVVQVSGELSNDGQPMRRFSQTFVLAALGSRKYYVHNDILAYQDLGHLGNKDQNREQITEPEVQLFDQAVQASCDMVSLNRDITLEDDQNKEQAENPEVKMGNQAVQLSCYINLYQGENERDQNREQITEPEVQLVDQAVQASCDMVSLNRDITLEDEQDQNKEQAENPEVQTVGQAGKAAFHMYQDLYKEDKENQNVKPDIQMVDEAVQVGCEMVSKYTQAEQVASIKTSSAASQTVEQQKPKETPAGFQVSPQFIQQQRKEQPVQTVMQNEQKESLPQKQLLFSESLGRQVAADPTNTNNKRHGKSLISIELDISIYLEDES